MCRYNIKINNNNNNDNNATNNDTENNNDMYIHAFIYISSYLY